MFDPKFLSTKFKTPACPPWPLYVLCSSADAGLRGPGAVQEELAELPDEPPLEVKKFLKKWWPLITTVLVAILALWAGYTRQVLTAKPELRSIGNQVRCRSS